jgi:hypothetical protein
VPSFGNGAPSGGFETGGPGAGAPFGAGNSFGGGNSYGGDSFGGGNSFGGSLLDSGSLPGGRGNNDGGLDAYAGDESAGPDGVDYKGLPRRQRQANIAPQLRSNSGAAEADIPQASAPNPADVKNTLSAMQRGWQQGRSQSQRDTEER